MVGSGDEYETCYETPIGASPIPPPTHTKEQIFRVLDIARKDGVLALALAMASYTADTSHQRMKFLPLTADGLCFLVTSFGTTPVLQGLGYCEKGWGLGFGRLRRSPTAPFATTQSL